MAPRKKKKSSRKRLRGVASALRRLPLVGAVRSWSARHRKELALVATLAGILALVAWSRCGLAGCPDVRTLSALQPDGAPVLLDRHGGELGHLRPVDRKPVPLDSLPPHVPRAFVAVEDRRFWDHRGVDWLRVPGALLANLRAGGPAQGFSTITMQLARNVFPERLPARQRTIRRKLLEIRVAGEIEEAFSKAEVLELYLNNIYFGGGVWGIDAASHHWFRKPPGELELHEAALLAALPKAPSTYDPRRHPEAARERRDLVLSILAERGFSADSTAAARERDLGVAERPPPQVREDRPAPWFVEAVRARLEEVVGPGLYHERIRVHTTLDPELQRAVADELETQARRVESGWYGAYRHPVRKPREPAPPEGTPYLQGAAVWIDARTGDVLALVGGRDWEQSSYDRALLARRQVGSAFKPFVYAAAVASGHAPGERIRDEPLHITQAGSDDYRPRNFDGRFHGEVTLREALVRSLNVPAVRLAREVGTGSVAGAAEEAGLDEVPTHPSMALGTVSATPLELALAYTPFATLGRGARRARFVTLVEDDQGQTLWRPEPVTEPVLEPGVAFLVTDMLRDAVDRGTGRAVRRAGHRGPAAGKTGTTSDARDVWFVGYTPGVVGVVWMGLDRPAPIVGGATGGGLAAPVWGRAMARAGSGLGSGGGEPASAGSAAQGAGSAPDGWDPPPSVVRVRYDPVSGTALSEGCELGDAVTDWALRAHLPPTGCPERPEEGRSLIDKIGGWISGLFGGNDGN